MMLSLTSSSARSRAAAGTLAAALFLTLLLIQQPASARRLSYDGPRLCAREGGAASSTWMNATRTCLKFHATGAPIQAPPDTNTSKWGQIWMTGFDDTAFIDRQGTTYPLKASITPAPQDLRQTWVLLLVKAKLRDGEVISFTPRLYVPYSTVMTTMVDSQFEGELYNMEPRPDGPNETSWFKWTFGKTITVTDPVDKYGTLLQGTFVNLFRAARDAQGVCQPALCADPTMASDACQYYISFFGNASMTLNWDPNMHAPGDTELVPLFPTTGRQYMAHFNNLYEMMLPQTSFLPRNYTFFGHGTPMATPQSFTGTLTKRKQTQYC